MWANGAAYEYYVGRWSRLVALQFLKSLEIPSDSKWLDVGCGTGILSQTILDIASPHSVVGVDTSEEYMEFACEQIHDQRIAFHLGDAQSLLVEPVAYDTVVSGVKCDDQSCALRWNGCSICMGLYGPYATHSVLLGRCGCSRQNDNCFR
jgi:SAM-dependent methyltransferase